MPEYRIYLLHPDGKIAEAIEFLGQDDLAARHKANSLCKAEGAEIWARTRLVARIARDEHAGGGAS